MPKPRFLPAIVLGICLVYVTLAMISPPESSSGFDVGGFGRLPVLMNGRVQPIDSVARIGLRQIRGTATAPLDADRRWLVRRSAPATEWLLEVLAKPDRADERAIFPVRNSTLSQVLGLSPHASSGAAYYSFRQLQPHVDQIGEQWRRITKLNAAERQGWEQECLRLRNAIVVYERLKNSLQPNSLLQQQAAGKPVAYDFPALLIQYQRDLREGLEAAVGREHATKSTLDPATIERMRAFGRPFVTVARVALPAMIPPIDPSRSRDRWENVGTALVESARTGRVPDSVAYFATMSTAFAQGRPADFNAALRKYRQWLAGRTFGPELGRARSEFFYNVFQPVARTAAIYLLAIMAIATFRFNRSVALHRSAAGILVLGWLLHTLVLLFDMMLQGRPPVTNTYSVIVFAGWAAVAIGVGVEWFARNGFGVLAASVAGLGALATASGLAPTGTLELMRSVSGLSFWTTAAAVVVVLRVWGGPAIPDWSLARNDRAARAAGGRARRLWRLGAS